MYKGGCRNVRLMLTPRAQRYIEDWKQKSELEDPIVQIGWGRWNHESEDHWILGLNDKVRMGPDWPGWLGIAPEFQFVVINPMLFDRLDGCIMDIDSKGSTKVDPHAT